jgi:hypothetical protein
MKTKINVHLLFLYGHHIEILLEIPSGTNVHIDVNPHQESIYYILNRWKEPGQSWDLDNKDVKSNRFKALLEKAEASYTFAIEEIPAEIIKEWNMYYKYTEDKAHIFGKNCAVASQWFLSKYAQIPHPKFWDAPFGVNQVMYYLHCPSFVPLFALLPRRVFENAKHHIDIRKKPNIKESYLQINLRIAVNSLLICGSVCG